MNLRSYRTFQALILAALGLFLLYQVVDGHIILYIHQRLVLLVLFAGVGMMALAQVVLRERGEIGEVGPEEHRLDDAGAVRRSWALWLVALPVLIGLLTPEGPQGAGELAQRGLAQTPAGERQPEVLYLSGVEAPELFRVALDGSPPRQLTDTGGKLYDFGVAADGSRIAYAAYNAQNGIDLWETSRDGGEPRLLLPCQSDWCISPAYSPDGSQVAYSRRQAGSAERAPGVARIWLLDMHTLETGILYSNPNVTGVDPTWSPDGRSLSFFDEAAGEVRVLNLDTGQETLLPSNLGSAGSWSPDSRRILYGNMVAADTPQPSVEVFVADLEIQQSRRVWSGDSDQMEYGPPAWSPDGEWGAAALRRVDEGPGMGLWRVSLDGSRREAIHAGALFTVGAYSWDPNGKMLVYQLFELGSSRSLPQVYLWRGAGQAPERLAEDAMFPRWLP